MVLTITEVRETPIYKIKGPAQRLAANSKGPQDPRGISGPGGA